MRCLVKLFILAGAFALLVVGCFWAQLPQQGIAVLIQQACAKRYSGRVLLEGVQIDGLSQLTLTGLAFQDDEGKATFLKVPTTRVRIALTHFFEGMKAVDGIVFEGPEANFDRDPQGKLVLARYVKTRTPTPEATPAAGKTPAETPAEGTAAPPPSSDEGLHIEVLRARVRYQHPGLPKVSALRDLSADLRKAGNHLFVRRCSGAIPGPLGLTLPFEFGNVTIDMNDPLRSPSVPMKAKLVLYLVADVFKVFSRT